MPKERFFSLPNEKKASILCAAKEEFTKFRFEEVSVSRIVRAARISQGSFYTYFENKEDLRQYLFEDLWLECRDWIYKTLELCSGDVCDTALYAVVKLLKLDKEQPKFRYYQNVLFDIGWMGRTDIDHLEDSSLSEETFRGFSDVCYAKADLSRIRAVDREGFTCLLELLIIIVLKCAVMYAAGNRENTKILMIAERQIQLLRA